MNNLEDFSFETVLSTDRNLVLLERAKECGYEVQCYYILTCDENINVVRVKQRKMSGGHDVPEEKIRIRYHRALALIPRLVQVCDKIEIYDNSELPVLIFRKQGVSYDILPCSYWSKPEIESLVFG